MLANMLNWPLLGTIYQSPKLLNLMRVLVLLLFVSAVYFGLTYPDESQNPYTAAVFWSLFWPFFLILSMVTLGPVFCSVCPHSFIGKYLNRIGPKKLMPNWMRNRWWGFGLLLLSYWVPVYVFPGFLKSPFVSAMYFLVLTIIAFAGFYLYRNMDYCRYVCPIGSVIKSYGKVGFSSLKTDQSNCKTCRSFDCVKSCEWNLRPYLFENKNNMQDCTLCMDCHHACDSVQWNLGAFAKQVSEPVKQLDRMTIWVFISLLAVITFTMRFHHALGHSPIKSELPWVQAGQWLETFMPAIPMVDWVGFAALVMAVVMTFGIVLGSFFVTSKFTKVSYGRVFEHAGLALAPLMLIGALSHIGSFFFLHYASDLGNAFYWLLGSDSTMHPLASRRDAWVHLFGLFHYLAVFVAAYVLVKKLKQLQLTTGKLVVATLTSGLIIWAYLGLVILTQWAMTLR
ncbi:4Fe-4S binding protein [Hydrogenovibrio marinus]|uniref:4Fe-4S ferredoxin-type domain-containing protein n=1 Tax=Hydrogenovibrio marinus TaxID=28885 RepID=A0A067A1A2_HYDMR|nr:4Fe-4S binding protein [Hydrogenovibrio marinus]KDN96125.1 hypothetical protein EI16_07500 [Hydrogenovibrio marinus]BBN60698.1 hypothetical protein HVMH_2292 [Hydrogenovibrio marinus]